MEVFVLEAEHEAARSYLLEPEGQRRKGLIASLMCLPSLPLSQSNTSSWGLTAQTDEPLGVHPYQPILDEGGRTGPAVTSPSSGESHR